MKNQLKKFLNLKNKITLLSCIDNKEYRYHGFIVGVSKKFVCMWTINDWHHDGYEIIPRRFVTKLINSK